MSKRDSDRATSIAVHAANVRAIIGSTYEVFFTAPASTYTTPDVQLVAVGIRLPHKVPFPKGLPMFRPGPGENDPDYGVPRPLDEALKQSDGSEGPTSAITVFVDLRAAAVFAIDPRGSGPDGPEG